MQSPQEEVCLEMLRARYAELLRLREYVERLENLRDEKATKRITGDSIREIEQQRAPRCVSKGDFGPAARAIDRSISNSPDRSVSSAIFRRKHPAVVKHQS